MVRYRSAQRARVARIDRAAERSGADRAEARQRLGEVDHGGPDWNRHRRRAIHARYLTIYRTLADPAYLDPTIEPDDRRLGSVFAAPDPLDANYGYGGLARTRPARGWPSTWSGLTSPAHPATTLRTVTVPTLILHATGDTEIRLRQARDLRDSSSAEDCSYSEIPGASHYLDGQRRVVLDEVIAWLRPRMP
ncbi:MAG: hypothetical protein WKF43_14190 [Acidimicrobiales bacterium]